MRRRFFWIALFGFVVALVGAPMAEQARTRIADGFDQPVGKPNAEGYYMSRGFFTYHPGEDWNGLAGGNSDLGAPVYCIGNGVVTFARDARMGWGNVVLVRHIYTENGKLETVDSMYAHLDKILVREGQQITRGQQVGTIGTNRGMYTAHLHFEIRKNLNIGLNRSSFARDLTNYYRPGSFIATRRKLRGAGRSAVVPVNTYDLRAFGNTASRTRKTSESEKPRATATPTPSERPRNFRVNRFDEMNSF